MSAEEPRVVHRYAAPFRAACGLSGAMTVHADDAKVTCTDCEAVPADPAAAADFDQLQATLRGIKGATQ